VWVSAFLQSSQITSVHSVLTQNYSRIAAEQAEGIIIRWPLAAVTDIIRQIISV